MSRISNVFENEEAFIGFITVGEHGAEYSAKAALALEKGGVNIIELGLPFSDPIGEGPVIQKASTKALKNKTTPKTMIDTIKAIRIKSEVPLVIMTYYNLILQAGKNYLSALKKAGADGIIIVDLPIEEATGYIKMMRDVKLNTIFLVTPNTTELRLMQIIHHSTGFIYYACQKGTTGMKSTLPKDLGENVQNIKDKTEKPVAVGFGIKSKQQAKKVLEHADGFVVGSMIVDFMSQKPPLKEITALAKKLKP